VVQDSVKNTDPGTPPEQDDRARGKVPPDQRSPYEPQQED